MTLLRLFVTISLKKIGKIDFNKQDDYGVHSLNNNTCMGLVIYLCLNTNPLISLIPRKASNSRHLLSCGTIGSEGLTLCFHFEFLNQIPYVL